MSDLIQKLQRRYERQVAAARYWLLGMSSSDMRYLRVLEAMEFGKAHHIGKRNGGGPEFMHQVEIFHLLRTLHHHLNDPVTVYILAFLHDCIEDAQKQPDGTKKYVGPQDITDRWGVEICDKLLNMSKEVLGIKNSEYSLDTVFNDPDTALAKLADRAHNISTMMGVFKRPRAERYIVETRDEFLPRAKSARRKFPAQESAFENLKLLLNCQLQLIDQMMPNYTLGVESNALASPSTSVINDLSDPPKPSPESRIKVGAILSLVDTGDGVNGRFALGHNDGSLIVRSKEDLAHFKARTKDSVVIMGSRTAESITGMAVVDNNGLVQIPNGEILPDRHVIVLTTRINTMFGNDAYTLVNPARYSVEEIIRLVKDNRLAKNFWKPDGIIWIAGGAQVYEHCLSNSLIDFIDYTLIVPNNEAQYLKLSDSLSANPYTSVDLGISIGKLREQCEASRGGNSYGTCKNGPIHVILCRGICTAA